MKAIITGATKGIGRATADIFARAGFDLALCSRTLTDLQRVEEELGDSYPDCRVLIHAADLSVKEEALAFGEKVNSAFGAVDVLVNNAGLFIPGSVYDEADGALENMIETNLYSAYHLTRKVLPPMLERSKGHIFNLCSIASIQAYPNGGSYSIAKFALLGFTKAIREELKEKNIRVTAILPGATWTPSWQGAGIPEERFIPAEDIAKTIFDAWQLSERSVVEEIIIRPQLGDV